MPDGTASERDELLRAVDGLLAVLKSARPEPQDMARLRSLIESETTRLTTVPAAANFREPDGGLLISRWAEVVYEASRPLLAVSDGKRSRAMVGAAATADPLVSNGYLGIDVIQVPAGTGFPPHTHVGDHLLITVAGTGTIAFEGRLYQTGPGQVYMVEGAAPHAVGAITDHVLLSVGSPHRAVDAEDRQQEVAYEAVTAALGDLECLICGIRAVAPRTLRDLGCPHCPSLFANHPTAAVLPVPMVTSAGNDLPGRNREG
jgi:quercetin dioxygenase-like cupin family protein